MIHIGIADDHAIVRCALRDLFASHVDLRVAGEARNGREALSLASTAELDVLVLDVSMPGQTGMETLNAIRVKAPQVGVLVLSAFDEFMYAENALQRGARGYLNKTCDPREIVQAVRAISLGNRHISPAVGDLLARRLERNCSRALHEHLAPREWEVFLNLAMGYTPTRIGKMMSLDVDTISTYRTRVLRKMDLRSNCDLTQYAMKHALLQ